jgi:CelD/BcsL family acetyltransferase involved in cellulose biosynthesis
VNLAGVDLTTARDIRGTVANWRALQAPGMASLFCGPSWTRAAWEHLPDMGAPYPLVYEDNAGVTMLPMSVVADGERRRIVFAGGPLIDAGDALSSASGPVQHTRRLIEQTRQLLAPGDRLDLRPIYPHSLIVRAMELGDIDGFAVHVQSAGVSPSVTLGSEPAPHLKSKFAGQLRQKSRRLTERGPISWRRRHRLLDADVRQFLERRAEQWPERRRGEVPWPQARPDFIDFVVALATSCENTETRTFIDELLVGDEVVAQDLYLDCVSHRLLYMRWFNIEYSSYAAGHLLVQLSMESEQLEGVTVLDFGRGDEDWKYSFGADDRELLWLNLTAI